MGRGWGIAEQGTEEGTDRGRGTLDVDGRRGLGAVDGGREPRPVNGGKGSGAEDGARETGPVGGGKRNRVRGRG